MRSESRPVRACAFHSRRAELASVTSARPRHCRLQRARLVESTRRRRKRVAVAAGRSSGALSLLSRRRLLASSPPSLPPSLLPPSLPRPLPPLGSPPACHFDLPPRSRGHGVAIARATTSAPRAALACQRRSARRIRAGSCPRCALAPPSSISDQWARSRALRSQRPRP